MKIARCVLRSTGILWVGLACAPAFAAAGVPAAPEGTNHPAHRSARVPADGAYGENGDRRTGRAHLLTIQRGVLTVDGMTVRTGLDFRISNMRYMYVYVPGAGTTVISERPFGGALEERAAFRGKTLTVNAGGSRLQLTSANKMRGSHSAYVRFDRGEVDGVNMAMVGFGNAALAPAVWASEDAGRWNPRRRVNVRGRRVRTAKLCRPSAHGPEKCALIREVAWER